MHRSSILTLSTVLLALSPLGAQREASAGGKRIEGALKLFDKQNAHEQRGILDAVRHAIGEIDDGYLDSVRALAAESRDTAKKKKLKTRQKKQKSSGLSSAWQDLPFPVHTEYLFGLQQTRETTDPSTRRMSKSRRDAARRHAELAAMLSGHAPDLDLALASLLRALDHDRSADALSGLFETWRNGEESFYHALDRTAGTENSLFFYDAMLDDFIGRCVPRKNADYKQLRRSHDDAHDALHRSFLAYRQYRAFREAVALAMLLPPDEALPKRLGRYEQAPSGMLTVRDQVGILLHVSEQNLRAAVRAIAGSAKPLPAPLWGKSYEPVTAFSALVAGLEYKAATDKVVATQRERQASLKRRIAITARHAFAARIGTKTD